LARPKYRETPRSARILSRVPDDGTKIALMDLRQECLERLHMSPSTVNKELKAMEGRLVERIVNASTRPPRIFYKRIVTTRPGKVEFDKWFAPRMMLLRLAALDAMEEILKSPNAELEEAVGSTMFNAIFSAGVWNFLEDFQTLVRSKRITDVGTVKDHVGRRTEYIDVVKSL